MDEKEKLNQTAAQDKSGNSAEKNQPQSQPSDQWLWDMKQELEDYIEEQGIYIRQ